MKKLFLILLILLFPCTGFGATYYVDNVAGADANAGTSEGVAWATLSKVNTSSFSADDTIKLKKGQTWNEPLIPPSSGTDGHPITFTSYGTGANPIVKNRYNFVKVNSGFETLTSGTPDDATTDDFGTWTEQAASGGYVEATATAYAGSRACLLNDGGTVGSTIYYNNMTWFGGASNYTMSIIVKRVAGTGQNLAVRIADTTSGTYDLQSDGTTWTLSSVTYLTWSNTTSATFEQKTFSFTTMASGPRSLRILIVNRDTNATYAVDNVVIYPGATLPYAGYGLIEVNGNPAYYIDINSKNYVVIDGIDTVGPREIAWPVATTFDNTNNVYFRGTSTGCAIQNGSITYSAGVGLDSVSTCVTTDYTNLSVHDNLNTGLYTHHVGGTISNCEVYDNKGAVGGDCGGMGIGEGSGGLTISDNIVHDNGNPTESSDAAISLYNISSACTIINNYIYNSDTGGIQVVGGTTTGTVIANNLINVFGTTSYATPVVGKCSGIRIGTTAASQGAPGVTVCNNTIMGGARAIDDSKYGCGIHVANADSLLCKLKNNIFSGNTCRDIAIDATAVSTEYEFSNNCYYKADYTGNFGFKGSNVNSLALWQAALLGNIKVPDIGSVATDPKFVSASDFSLQADSPCINAGVFPGGSINTDYAGNPIPRGPAFDIGAYEYQAGGTIYGGSITGTIQ